MPQRVQHERPAVRAGLGECQLLAGGERVARIQQPGQRRDQAADRAGVELVLTAEAVDHLRHRPACGRVPLVVRELKVAHRAVLGPPDRGLHIHRSRSLQATPH